MAMVMVMVIKVEGDSEIGFEIDLGDGCKVQHVNTSYQGKYFQRSNDDDYADVGGQCIW